jgi:bifunctional DNA-binding transcriptional regulator/antitoxin component of YhaV-PrlF toxin-antitoxin module
MITTVTGKNQVSIPAALARAHGIKPGWRVEWREGDADDELVMRLMPDRATLARQLRGAGRKWLAAGSDPVEELVRERASEE